MARMKAALSKEVGGPESLVMEEVPDLRAGPGNVVVDIKACGVNYPDALMLRDMYQFKPPRPFAPGGEIAGIVDHVGDGVEGWKPGDRVVAVCGNGGMAEQIELPAPGLLPVPEDVPLDEASAFLLTYGTSLYALKDRAEVRAGESLLVLGAAGGVGLSAVQLGAAMGTEVIAACSSQDKVDLCLEHGASKGIVYPRGPLDRDQQKQLSNDIKEAGGGGVDVVYDAVGGDYAEPAVRAMNWEGRFLVIGFPAGIPKLPLNLTLLKNCQIVGVFWGAFTARQPDDNAANVSQLFQMYADGQIKPYVSSRYPLDQAGDAIAELEERRAKGKVVVTV